MTESSSMKDWQLEESSGAENQWQLLDTEQELPAEMTLQEGIDSQQEWQPVAQAADEGSGGRNWILPSFIILAMIAVVSYIAWLGFSGVGLLPPGTSAAESTPGIEEPDAGQMAVAAPATEAPATTATPMPEPTETAAPTPPASPTPAMVEQKLATINSPYGLNARAGESPDSEVIAILDDDAVFVIIAEGAERTQIQLDDGTTAYVATEFIEISSQMVPGSAAPAPEAESAEVVAAEPESTQAEGEAGVPTEAAQSPKLDVEPPEPFTNVIPDGAAVLVLIEGGVNARPDPSTDSDVILIIPQGAALSATGQDASGEWLQVELPNGTPAWVFASNVDTAGAIEALPVVGAEEEIAVSTPPAEEEAADSEATVEPDVGEDAGAPDTAAEPDTVADAVEPQVTVDSLISIKARTLPVLDADVAEMLSNGTTLTATGRTADNTWIRVQLANGDDAWLLIGAVLLNVEPTALPVVEP